MIWLTEMTFQFIAKDLKTISKLNVIENDMVREEEIKAMLRNPYTQDITCSNNLKH